jgi:hypothetical protein
VLELDDAGIRPRLALALGDDLGLTRTVSPWNRGAGNVTSLMPRLAMVVPTVRSLTEMPIISPRVNSEFISGWPHSVPAQKCRSIWSGCGFIVRQENIMLSISVTVRVIGCAYTLPISNSSNHSPAILPSFICNRPVLAATRPPSRGKKAAADVEPAALGRTPERPHTGLTTKAAQLWKSLWKTC